MMLLSGGEMLGAYRVHSDIELAKYATEHLLSLLSKNPPSGLDVLEYEKCILQCF